MLWSTLTLKAGLTGDVDVNFESDDFPLGNFADDPKDNSER